MLELGVFGGKYMTDCTEEFPAAWFQKARMCHERHDPGLNLFGVNASLPARRVAEAGVDLSRGPEGVVSMVLQILHGEKVFGRRTPDQKMEGDTETCYPDHAQLQGGRPWLPEEAEAGCTPLGI